MRRSPCWPAVCLLLAAAAPVTACTNVFSAHGDERLVGANLDCNNYFPRIWFVPAGENRYGRFCYGTDAAMRIAEGGCNEQGLFIGVNALNADSGWTPDPALPDWEQWEGWYGSGVPDGILARCRTVDEAVDIFRSYNLFTLNRVKFLVADAAGSSSVIEWHAGGLVVLPRGGADFQVATNFLQADHPDGEYPCTRYRLAAAMLQEGAAAATVPGLRALLSAVHLEFQTPTVVSSICDLRTGKITIYHFHDFEQPVAFDLGQELAAGRHGWLVGDLVPRKSYVATYYEGIGR